MLNPIFRRAAIGLAATLFCVNPNCLKAAQTDTLTDSRTLIVKGMELHDEGSYKEAITQYRKVPEGDTNYALALHEQALSALSDSAYADARRLALQGLALPGNPSRREFLLLLGHANDYLGDVKAALQCYDSLIKLNPYDHQPLYEKGATYLRQKDYEQAKSYFQHSMMLNPNHYRSHLNTGVALYQQGRFAEAYLALCFALFTTSDGTSAGNVIDILTAIRQQTDEVVEAWQSRDPANIDPAFEEVDAIIHAKLAQSKDYKFESVLSGDGTINTIHLILEKVKWDASDTGLVMQYYMPFYKAAYDAGKFDPMVLLMFSGYNIEVIEKLAKKQSKSIDGFRGDLSAYTDKIIATQVLPYNKRKTAPELYSYLASDDVLVVGGLQSLDPLKFKPGPVQIYRDGYFSGKGTANASGNKDGEWIFYYDNGNIRSIETYRDGKEIGEAIYYRRNGTRSTLYKYSKDGKMLEKQEFTYNGVLDAVTKDAGDKEEYVSYHVNGAIEYRTFMRDGDVIEPVLKRAYDNGQPAQEVHLANGKRNGICKEYYYSGKLSEETEYKDGKREGKSTTYFNNGQVHFKFSYSDNKLDGPFEEYNENGKIIERGMYHNGRKTGTVEELTPEGRVFGTITYRKDLPVAYSYTDEQGKVLSGAEKGGNLDMLVTYYPNGNKRSELPLRSGKIEGLAKYYFLTGSVRKHVTFSDDKSEGPVTEFFRNGRVSSKAYNHDNGILGLYLGNNDGGTKRSEGYLDGSERCGVWHFYHPDGKLEEEDFYVNGMVNGPQKNYRGDGSLHYVNLYDRDMIIGLIEYDTAGRELYRESFPAGNGVYARHGVNGKKVFTTTLRYGKYDGPYTRFFPDGSVSEKGFFRYGSSDSMTVGYHPNGQVGVSGRSRKGKWEGLWTYYDDAGSKVQETNYRESEQEGVEKIWIAGNLQTMCDYHDGERHGREVFYGENEEVAGVLFYEEGILMGYSYHGKDGKELPMIPLKNATGHVTTFYPNGKKGIDYNFVEGRKEGPALRWYSNGQQAQVYLYATGSGDAEGQFQKWSPSGQLVYEANYHQDVIYGQERYWDAKGRLTRSTEYSSNGSEHGARQSIDPSAGKKASVTYYYGVEMSMN